MKKSPLWPFFLIAIFFAFYSSALFSGYRFLPFVPFLIKAFNRYPLSKMLWIAAGCGLIIDLLSSDHPFGLHGLNHVLSVFMLYRFRHFFVEKAHGLCSYTAIFSLLSTIVGRLLISFFGVKLTFTWQSIFTDFIFMPLLDGIYAFLGFYCPIVLYFFLKKQWIRFLFFKEDFKKKREKASNV